MIGHDDTDRAPAQRVDPMPTIDPAAGLDPTLLNAARVAKGFMPDDEGLALAKAALEVASLGPLLEIGTYCGKSSLYLAGPAREAGTVVFTIDHHHGSEEMQAGWEHHDTSLIDEHTGRMDSSVQFRRTIADAGVSDVVIGIIGDSPKVAHHWNTPLSLVFIDGAHSYEPALADYLGWSPHVVPGGYLVFHDVFEDPDLGGQGPWQVYCEAISSGVFSPVRTVGSMRILVRSDGPTR